MIYSFAYSNSQTQWNALADCLSVNRATFSGGILDLLTTITSNQKAKDCIDTYNNNLQHALLDKTDAYLQINNVGSAEMTNDGLVVGLDIATVFPTFIIDLDASKVGIVELSGKPQISTCVLGKTIKSGDTYSTSVSVTNVGNQDGSFYGQLSCTGSSGMSGTVSEQTVRAGQTSNLPVQLSGTNTASGTQTNDCTITIIDRKSQDSDSCNFDVGVEYQPNIVCEAGKVTCFSSTYLKICNSEGTDFDTDECESGCELLSDGTGQCKGGECSSDADCGKKYSCVGNMCVKDEGGLAWYYSVAIILGAILVLVIILKIAFSGRNKWKKE